MCRHHRWLRIPGAHQDPAKNPSKATIRSLCIERDFPYVENHLECASHDNVPEYRLAPHDREIQTEIVDYSNFHVRLKHQGSWPFQRAAIRQLQKLLQQPRAPQPIRT